MILLRSVRTTHDDDMNSRRFRDYSTDRLCGTVLRTLLREKERVWKSPPTRNNEAVAQYVELGLRRREGTHSSLPGMRTTRVSAQRQRSPPQPQAQVGTPPFQTSFGPPCTQPQLCAAGVSQWRELYVRRTSGATGPSLHHLSGRSRRRRPRPFDACGLAEEELLSKRGSRDWSDGAQNR